MKNIFLNPETDANERDRSLRSEKLKSLFFALFLICPTISIESNSIDFD